MNDGLSGSHHPNGWPRRALDLRLLAAVEDPFREAVELDGNLNAWLRTVKTAGAY
jgi:hypothetical protein